MNEEEKKSSIWPWVIRIVFALLAVAAPIITFKAFTEWDFGDPQRDDQLREIEERNKRNRENPPPREPMNPPIER